LREDQNGGRDFQIRWKHTRGMKSLALHHDSATESKNKQLKTNPVEKPNGESQSFV
jgi:hypothetical protein